MGGVDRTEWRALRIAGPLCLVLAAAPAAADWEYTRWGMSVDQVKAAAKGKAVDNLDRELDGGDFKTLLVSTHGMGKMRFRAAFRFDNATLALNSVGLKALDPRDCPALKEQLLKRYGASESRSVYLLKWRDVPAGNAVQLALFGGCAIDYQPLASAGPKPGA